MIKYGPTGNKFLKQPRASPFFRFRKPYLKTPASPTSTPKILQKQFVPSTPCSSPPSKAPGNLLRHAFPPSNSRPKIVQKLSSQCRPRCLTSLSDPVKQVFQAASSKPFLSLSEALLKNSSKPYFHTKNHPKTVHTLNTRLVPSLQGSRQSASPRLSTI